MIYEFNFQIKLPEIIAPSINQLILSLRTRYLRNYARFDYFCIIKVVQILTLAVGLDESPVRLPTIRYMYRKKLNK